MGVSFGIACPSVAPKNYVRPASQYHNNGWTQVHRGTAEKEDEKTLKQAINILDIKRLRYKIGQKITISSAREELGLRRAKGVIVGDYARYILVSIKRDGGRRREKVTILKVDIVRGRDKMPSNTKDHGSIRDKGGEIEIELY